MIPHILLLWTMSISTLTGTEHGNWRYLGTYENESLCRNVFVDLSEHNYSIYGIFKCVPQSEMEIPKVDTSSWVRY